MTDTEIISKVTDIINDAHIGMLTTINEEGALVSRPLAVQDVQEDGDLWFFTGRGTSQVSHIQADPRVNVSFGRRTEWVSVAGTAEVVTDRAKIHEMWNQVVEAWFPDGPDTPEVCLLRVDSESAEYWTSPGGTAATVIQWVKSKVTHSRMSVGESGTVEL
ncbi:pyridoxamine 5'-phosphate oxidase family protein [Pseudarthrobacter sp. AL07]|uniref:pyridoxamine 5'-phosphate oxidase family protein n=1 Tax=unclassified Pseudarthrobacter TaxID=2647000 RepID=UPI00249CE42B|nr:MULTISPECIES: pyridoxamine 5'-phosphate oxidase family protein [unclassified Pseudarthrobacter]MDI3195816.1 pyridoxamine 5'-phosphate oxidase family protein [Pseudarthrobacter sp. AL20]MDI3209930.1 pyridoxamine 5'-phosphate oxidase family protein [Pseudarthrobacter sp. AL07]